MCGLSMWEVQWLGLMPMIRQPRNRAPLWMWTVWLIQTRTANMLHLKNCSVLSIFRINGAFTVELGEYIADSGIDYWIYGHSHRNIDAQIGKTKIMSNQLGYISHNEYTYNGFNSGKCLSIED